MAETISEGYKIGSLIDRNRELVCVVSTEKLREAITKMVSNDFSQLPVVKDGGKRAKVFAGLKGVVSWGSIGKRIIKPGLDVEKEVREFMDESWRCSKCRPDALIKDVVEQLQREENEYVIVVDGEIIQGIVTHYDIAQAYAKSVGPFTDIESIEIALRNLLRDSGIAIDDINKALGEASGGKESSPISQLDDLDFAGYHKIAGKLWDRLNIGWGRDEFLKRLGEVREIRNRIMHFRPGGLSEADKQAIRSMREFLR